MWIAVVLVSLGALLGSENTPPVAEAGTDAAVACEIEGAAAVTLDGSASKDADSTPGSNDDIVKYVWAEGDTVLASEAKPVVQLPVGPHVLTLTVTDAAGAVGSDEVSVVVYDDAPPLIACPKDLTVECASPEGTYAALGRASAKDNCFATAVVVNDRTDGGIDASGIYRFGTTVVTFTATDASGLTATCQTIVTVTDSVAPRLVVRASPAVLSPANHAMRRVDLRAEAADACDPSPRVLLVSAVSSEPDDAPGGGDGSTLGDIQDVSAGTADLAVSLRAERSGSGPGRLYTIHYVAVDAAGNATPASTTVSVPH